MCYENISFQAGQSEISFVSCGHFSRSYCVGYNWHNISLTAAGQDIFYTKTAWHRNNFRINSPLRGKLSVPTHVQQSRLLMSASLLAYEALQQTVEMSWRSYPITLMNQSQLRYSEWPTPSTWFRMRLNTSPSVSYDGIYIIAIYDTSI